MGKELLSQAIHNDSERAEGPYIAVNCQLYAERALDFASTTAGEEGEGRLSRLELANGGTLYLEKSNISPRHCSRRCCRSSNRA